MAHSKHNKRYKLSKEWLYQKYWIENLGSQEIAEMIGCTRNTIYLKLKKLGVEIKSAALRAPPEKKYKINKDWLLRLYWDENKSTTQIAKELGCSAPTVIACMKEYGIPLRTASERKRGAFNPMFGIIGESNPLHGKKRPKEVIEKIKQSLPRGSRHFRYKNPKDRVSVLNDQIRNCQKNKDWKFFILKRDDFTCQNCFKTAKNTILEVDHIIPFASIKKTFKIESLDAAIKCPAFWDTHNGRTLCVKCHRKTKTWGSKKNG